MDRWSMITPRTSSEFQYSNEKIRIESGMAGDFSTGQEMADIVRFRSPLRYRSSLSPFSFFFHHPRGFSLAGPTASSGTLFRLITVMSIDWSRSFPPFSMGSIVAKVLIKSGRNCILGRFEDNPFLGLRAIRKAGKAGGRPPPGIREREGILSVFNPNFFSLEIDREMFSKRMFLEHPSSPPIPWNTWEEGDRSWKSTVCVSRSCVLFTTRVSPLWKKRNFEVIGIVPYLLREEAVQLSDSSIFPRVRLANSDKESLSLSLNLPPN